jgi:hypothetical protein
MGVERKTDRLGRTLKHIPAKQIRASMTKTRMLVMRVTADDHAGMHRTAKACGMTVTEYMTRLHLFAAPKLADRRRERIE